MCLVRVPLCWLYAHSMYIEVVCTMVCTDEKIEYKKVKLEKLKLDDRRKLTAESHLRPHAWSSADLELDFSASLTVLQINSTHV